MFEIQAQLIRFIEQGCVDERPLRALSTSEGTLINAESELWDYKIKIVDDSCAYAELIRDLLAFYNSFGGYIVIGAGDDGKLVGADKISESRLRDLARKYTGRDLGVCARSVHFNEVDLQLIYIPKRAPKDVPLPVSRIGPEVERKPVFKPGDVFFRSLDSSQLIRGAEDLRFLLTSREHSAERGIRGLHIEVNHNLPDRSIVFSKFFGREEIKRDLWKWLADPLSRYRVVAGPGGFGKTSAAYSFCEEVCAETPLGIEQVVWLSAKKAQFDPVKNELGLLPYAKEPRLYGEHFFDFGSLLDALSYHVAITDEEWDGVDVSGKLELLSHGFSYLSSLVIIDDLDSLTTDEQRRVVELAMTLGMSRSRFLVTTRKNFLAPSSSTTELRGLSGQEYREYLEYLQQLYGRKLKASQVKTLAQETEGSPLFTESIFRLLRLGAKFSDAMGRWNGKDGEAVRAASFSRELEQLPWAAKKVLYAISLFDSLSAAEIRVLTELEIPEVEGALQELEGLFLVNSRQIGEEPRFGVAPNLRRLLGEMKESVPNQSDISRRAAQARTDARTGALRGSKREIGNAIRQAVAQMREEDFLGAKSTIESALELYPKSADLMMVYARCLTNIEPVEVQEVRRAFQRSFDLGKKESELFIRWADFELAHKNPSGAIDALEKGSKSRSNSGWRWSERQTFAYRERGLEREARREFVDAMSDLKAAFQAVKRALADAPGSARSSLIAVAQDLNDRIWILVRSSGAFSIDDQFYFSRQATIAGDRREVCLMRMAESIGSAMSDAVLMARKPEKIEGWLEDLESALALRDSPKADAQLKMLRRTFEAQRW